MDLRDVPAPDLEDPLFQPYWAGAAEGKLVLPRCSGCERVNWPPRSVCPHCRSTESAWAEHQPHGTLFSWTVVGRATAPGYHEVPYAVGIVALDDAPVRLMGTIVGAEPSALVMDMPMSARFAPAGSSPEFTLVQWEPTADLSATPTNPGS
ncbi:zinc ribbon domain-containing protein [Haloactinopolyspora sp.]|uniref:Zn-ribbon domain-containing OB-fold protein n=1 Tax=Haloactinopolyspora sp. TaxID=1966353 RepID=UPI00261A76C9|nr:zinc ribbon domain-containing protein [Haloactinopolyspora sp.]